MTDTTSALDWAMHYADIGWHVFPCKPDKTPATEHGFKEATTDHAQIVAWWRKSPDAHIGIATGLSGLCVVDLDFDPARGKDGATVFSQLAGTEPHGCGLIASTPRGGRHHVYLMPDPIVASRTGVRPGIDVKADGGYVVVPSGVPGREWMVGDPFAANQEDGTSDVLQMPAWVLELVRGDGAQERPGIYTGTSSARKRVEVASAVHAIPPSVGRSEWLQAIFATHAALDGDPVGARLVEAWSSLSDATDSEGKQQYRSGEARKVYRGSLLPEFLAGRQSVDSGTLWALARSYGWRSAGQGADDVQILLGTETPTARSNEIEFGDTIRGLDFEDVGKLPPIEWQVEGLIPEKSLVLLAGDTEAGKSFLAFDLALRMVHGMPFCGLRTKPGSVIYMAGEGFSGLAGRVRAWQRYHEAPNREDRFCVVLDGIPLLSKATMSSITAMIEKTIAAKGHAPALIILDTLSQGIEGDENDAKVVSPVLRALSKLRTKYGCSFLIVHHLVKLNANGKGAPSKPNKDSIRGSGALTRNVETVLGLMVDGVGNLRHLHVWKQKDGEKPQPIPLRLQVVETGHKRIDGRAEKSCVVIPEVQIEEPSTNGHVPTPEQAHYAAIEILVNRVLAELDRMGSAPSKSAVCLNIIGKRSDRYAAFDYAVGTGRIKNTGSENSPCFVVSRGGVPQERSKEGRTGTGDYVPAPPSLAVPLGPKGQLGGQRGQEGAQETNGELE